jgi:chaperone required for assembly of F1-ATPase
MSWPSRKRFWSDVAVAARDGGHAVLLDGKPLNTPSRQLLLLPTAAIARGVAREWQDLETEIVPERLPLTRAANSALDRVAPNHAGVVDALAAYGETDLLCYRADGPAPLVRRQAEAWDPWLDWAGSDLGAPLAVTTGVMPLPQPPASLAALHRAVAGHDAFALTGLHELVSLSGSLVLGLAVSRGALAADMAWPISRVDEIWQAGQWGLDAEAEAAAEAKRRAFLQAARLLELLDN